MPTLEKVIEKVVEPTYEHIWVTPRQDDGKCALWEIHPQHPAPRGEVFVDPGETVLVARTPAVDEAISDRRLREVHNYTPPVKPATSPQNDDGGRRARHTDG